MRYWIVLVLVVVIAGYAFRKVPQDPKTTELAGIAMTMPYRVVIGQELSQKQQGDIQNVIASAFNEVDLLYNQFNPNSEVSRLNQLPAHVSVPLSLEMDHFLTLVDRLVTITDGRFDPTVEPLKELWVPHLSKGTLPSEEELAALQPVIGWSHIHLAEGQFSKDHADIKLNLDAVAKGYGVDLLVQKLSQAGYPSVFVEWGGEVKAMGRHPEGRLWRIFISGLESTNPDKALAYVDLDNSALATSGDYYQNWMVGERTYCHVFDPRSLKPLEVKPGSVASASVMSSSCAAADALATASMVFDDVSEAQSWTAKIQQKYPSITFWLVKR